MLDSGSAFNLIKSRFLQDHITINIDDIVTFKGISSEIISSIGSVEILLLNQPTKFQVIPDLVGLPHDGILGNPFFQKNSVNINYQTKSLSYQDIKIPFANSEIIILKARSVTPFHVNIINVEKQVGYLPLYAIADKIYLGDAIVTNSKGKAYLPIFNTSDSEQKVRIPSVELQDFDTATSVEQAAFPPHLPNHLLNPESLTHLKNNIDNIGSGIEPLEANVSLGDENNSLHTVKTRGHATVPLNLETPLNLNGDKKDNAVRYRKSPKINVNLDDNLLSLHATETRGHTVAPSLSPVTYNKSIDNIGGVRRSSNEADVSLGVSSVLQHVTETRGHSVILANVTNSANSINSTTANSETRSNPHTKGVRGRPEVPAYDNPVYFHYTTECHPKCTHSLENNRTSTILNLLRLDHLNPEEIENIKTLINENEDRFHLPGDSLEATNAAEHFIPTTDDIPVHTKQYRFPPVHKEEISKQINDLLINDSIEHSTSPYNSPLWIVPKKPDSQGNKRWRLVIDYRNLNEKTIGDAYPLPNITDILDQLGSAKYFSVLDLASGFHQIPMASKDAPKTAFSTPYGHYQFKRMPFGLKNAPATFQRLMDNVLSGLQGNELFVYMDDIVIYAKSLREHEIKFTRLMQRLRNANLKLQPDKCEFLRHEVAYLGHIIGSNGVRPDPGKINSIMNFPTPKTPKNIKQFLGLAGYYRRFIPNFSKTAKPLTNLLKKNSTFSWQVKQIDSFNTLKLALCSNPILQYPDFTKPFILTTDASGYAIRGVLSQGPVGQDLPISYTSRILNAAEKNYSTIEKECLVIVYCVNHFRPYLYGKRFTIITDHKPLVWLNSIKDPSSRLWKWRNKLSEYDFEIKYKKGTLNNNADALSRNPPENHVFPLINADQDDSSDESLFFSSNKNRTTPQTPPPNTNNENRISIETHDDYVDMNASQNSNHENLEEISDYTKSDTDDDEEYYDELLTPISTPHEQIPLLPLALQEPTIDKTRENLLSRKDNHVIFIYLNGTPFDNGAKQYSEANLLPNYENLTYERANVRTIKGNTVISLPIKFNNRTLLEPQTLKNCFQSLVDVITELELKSISVSKTESFDDIPWSYVLKQFKIYLTGTNCQITICENLIRNPEPHEREALILENHASSHGGHKGVTKTYNRLRPHYFWSSMKKDISDLIRKCKQCQIKKLTRIKTKEPMIITDTPGTAFDKVSLDIMGPLPITIKGNQYILTMQDLLTKYTVAVPLNDATSVSIADAFAKNFICIYGAPKAILTDQGANFLSSLMRSLTKKFNIQHFKTTAYYPQSNGSLERSHHVLTEYLKTQIDKEDNWDDYINMALFSYNTSVHERTKFSPYELIFGKLARLPSSHPPLESNNENTYHEYITDLANRLHETREEARQNLISAKERSKRYYDRHINPRHFEEDTEVFLLKEPSKGKFSDQYVGPYKVIENLPPCNVKILIGKRPRVVHINKLKVAHLDPG
ncbi:uncharacterized protein LOC118644842 [Monomorium pharaonis]|uniref:uncharacterized protein LOC118644842 n=1 Tax=Monomorium pharaonis TaxID=307658 RepID=UPI0017460434|nr:uncharacterized protein LOC118644842 [Monomorium pharaonis]